MVERIIPVCFRQDEALMLESENAGAHFSIDACSLMNSRTESLSGIPSKIAVFPVPQTLPMTFPEILNL